MRRNSKSPRDRAKPERPGRSFAPKQLRRDASTAAVQRRPEQPRRLGKQEASEASVRLLPALQRTATAAREAPQPLPAPGRDRPEHRHRPDRRENSLGLKLPGKPGASSLHAQPSSHNLAPLAPMKPAPPAQAPAAFHVRPAHQYDFGSGNNSELVLRVFARRPWWAEAKKSRRPQAVNFYWRSKLDVNFSLFSPDPSSPKIINRFERFTELHQKDNVFRNMWFECRVPSD